MGQSIPHQHPAVVLRSHYTALRALLAVAMVAVAMLAATVVVLAADDGVSRTVTSARAAVPERVAPTMGEEMAQRRAAIGGKANRVRPGH